MTLPLRILCIYAFCTWIGREVEHHVQLHQNSKRVKGANAILCNKYTPTTCSPSTVRNDTRRSQKHNNEIALLKKAFLLPSKTRLELNCVSLNVEKRIAAPDKRLYLSCISVSWFSFNSLTMCRRFLFLIHSPTCCCWPKHVRTLIEELEAFVVEVDLQSEWSVEMTVVKVSHSAATDLFPSFNLPSWQGGLPNDHSFYLREELCVFLKRCNGTLSSNTKLSKAGTPENAPPFHQDIYKLLVGFASWKLNSSSQHTDAEYSSSEKK